MKRQKQMQKAFGINEFGLVDFPVKISKYRESSTEMKEVAPCAFLMDGNLATQQCSLTDNETGSASEKQDESPSKRKAGSPRRYGHRNKKPRILYGFEVLDLFD